MLARRVVALSPDEAFAKRLGQGLMAAGAAVETHATLATLAPGPIHASLVVVQAVETLATVDAVAQRLADDARIIVVSPTATLADIVECMRVDARVVAVLDADSLTAQSLAAAASRALYGDVFGLEKVVPWGTKVHSVLVGDYQEKSLCIAQLSEAAAAMGIRRKYRDAIEQCADEMLMNALYDAPVDAAGRQLFGDIPTKTRISLRMEQKAVVQFAFTGESFVLSVRDSFGTLARETMLRYLHKCLHAEQQIDRKTGGAGLGLYIIANACSAFSFNELEGVATECICRFDITQTKLQLEEFGFFAEKIDAAARLAAGPSQLVPALRAPSPRPAIAPLVSLLSVVVVLLMGLLGLLAYPRLAAPSRASLRVHTDPIGAAVDVNGVGRGTTGGQGLLLEDLELAHSYRITARKPGFRPREQLVEATIEPTTLRLALLPEASILAVDSRPKGAAVFRGDEQLGLTPLSVTSLPSSTEVELVLRKPGYRDQRYRARVPGPGERAFVDLELALAAGLGSLDLTSEPAGAQLYLNDELVAGALTPIRELLLEAGRPHRVRLVRKGYAPRELTVELGSGEHAAPQHVELQPQGELIIAADRRGVASVVGVRQCQRKPLPMRCVLPHGTYQVRVVSPRSGARQVFEVAVKEERVERQLRLRPPQRGEQARGAGSVATPRP